MKYKFELESAKTFLQNYCTDEVPNDNLAIKNLVNIGVKIVIFSGISIGEEEVIYLDQCDLDNLIYEVI